MKRFAFLLVGLLVAQTVAAQVIFRNDFVINRKQRKIENKGLTFISINLDNRPNLNFLINGRGGRNMQIDVRAIRHPRREYQYAEIAEKIYLPTVVSSLPLNQTVPLFLLMPPPHIKMPALFLEQGDSF